MMAYSVWIDADQIESDLSLHLIHRLQIMTRCPEKSSGFGFRHRFLDPLIGLSSLLYFHDNEYVAVESEDIDLATPTFISSRDDRETSFEQIGSGAIFRIRS